jgi:eukaryotic-like serine/threonine-protein kinase
MSVSEQAPIVCEAYRFDHFEVQVHSETLLRDGERIRIQALPFRLLLILLENAGSVVSSEDLGRRLGGLSYQVELGSLRVAATKLREALGDEASAPRFIKTVSGQGYKFIAEVTQVVDSAGEPAVPELQSSSLMLPETTIGSSIRLRRRLRRPALKSGLAILAVTVAVFAIAGLLIYRYKQRPIATQQDTIVLGGFSNQTGDHAMDETLASAFQVKMQESPYLHLVADRKLRSLVRAPETATLNETLAACRNLKGQILVRGQLAVRKLAPVVILSAWSCADGRQLTSRAVQADSKDGILSALNRAAEQMRSRLGETDESLQKFNVPVSQATTSSLAALRAFTQGEDKRAQGLESQAVADYQFAADLDPRFALAFARLGSIYYNSGEYALSRQNLQKAFDLRDRTTDHERLYITANYYGFATGEVERAIGAYQLWRKIYPQDIAPINNLAVEYLLIGQPAAAVEPARTALLLDPTSSLAQATLVTTDLKMGDWTDLNQLCNAPPDQAGNSIVFHVTCFQGAFAQHDRAAMRRHLDWGRGNPQQTQLLQEEATAAVAEGRMADSRRIFAQARRSALDNNLPEFAANTTLNEAGLAADLGYSRDARDGVEGALRLAPAGAPTQASAAIAIARAGDVVRAQALADEANRQSPLDTMLNAAFLAAERAAIHLQKHESQAAVQALEETRPYDFNEFMCLAPAYYRGLAYLQGHQPDRAVAEFRRELGNRFSAPDCPYVVLSQLELGRVLQLQGNTVEAALQYRALDEAWKNADSDFPPLLQLHSYERQLTSHGQH